MIPVMLVLFCVSDLTLTDFKTGCNVIAKEQAEYNSEIGMSDALKRYSGLTYSGFRISTYYMDLSTDIPLTTAAVSSSNNYVKVKVSYVNSSGKRVYTVDAIGYYYGSEKEKLYRFTE